MRLRPCYAATASNAFAGMVKLGFCGTASTVTAASLSHQFCPPELPRLGWSGRRPPPRGVFAVAVGEGVSILLCKRPGLVFGDGVRGNQEFGCERRLRLLCLRR
jgi:hypothetical protein